jgi:kynurenine formamidase
MEPRVNGDNWGRWGADDERGALNLITEEAIRVAAGTVQRGHVYSLGLPIDAKATPVLPNKGEPRRFTLTSDSDADLYASFGAAPGVGGNQDVLMIPSHHGTHIDALSHVFSQHLMFNGFESSTFTSFSGASRLGVEKLGAIVGRGVLLDVAAFSGVEALPAGYRITSDELDSCAQSQGTTIQAGDILLLRTGWIEEWARTRSQQAGQPGIGLDATAFIRDNDVAVVGADNSAVEVMPFDGGTFLAVHIELLVHLGVPLIEHLYLAELARDCIYKFLFMAAPLKVTGAAGSPINPVAVV